MTTEAPTTQAPAQTPPPSPSSTEERLARIEAQQEIIIELLRAHNAKFDRIDDRFDMLEYKFDAKIDALDKKFDAKIDALDKKFDAKIDALDKKFDAKIDTVNTRIDTINHRIFIAGLGLFTIVGAGVAIYIANLLT